MTLGELTIKTERGSRYLYDNYAIGTDRREQENSSTAFDSQRIKMETQKPRNPSTNEAVKPH